MFKEINHKSIFTNTIQKYICQKIITRKVTGQNKWIEKAIRIITRVSYQKKNKNSTHKKRHEVKRNSKIIEEKSKDSMRNWKLSKLCFYFFPYF